MKRFVFCLLIFVVSASSVVAQTGLQDRLPPGTYEVVLAPDAPLFASLNHETMVVHGPAFDESWPTPLPLQGIAWSPNDSIALMERGGGVNEFEIASTDIWRFHLAGDEFVNVTNNTAYQGFAGEPITAAFNMDYSPVWHPDGTLYFFRSAYQPGDDWYARPIALYRVVDDEPVLARELFRHDKAPPALMPTPTYIDASFAGNRLAFVLVTDRDNPPDSTGVWLYDVANDTLEQLVGADDWCVGLPTWMDCYLLPETVEWVLDDGWVVRLANRHPDSLYREFLPAVHVYLDLNDGSMTPLLDYFMISDEAALFTTTWIIDTGTVVGSSFVYVSGTGVSSLALPPDEMAPEPIAALDDFNRFDPPRLATGNSVGMFIVYGHLFQLSPPAYGDRSD